MTMVVTRIPSIYLFVWVFDVRGVAMKFPESFYCAS